MSDPRSNNPQAHLPEGLAALAELHGVTRMEARPGEVLVHDDHVSKGLYVVVQGEVDLIPRHGNPVTWSAADGPFALPHPAELEEPAGQTAILRTRATVLYVPRSLLLLDEAVRPRLEAVVQRMASLRAAPEAASA